MHKAMTIVLGYDGSDAARRALTRMRGLDERVSTVLVVAVAPDLHSAGRGSALVGGTFDAQSLLDEAFARLHPPEGMSVELRTEAEVRP